MSQPPDAELLETEPRMPSDDGLIEEARQTLDEILADGYTLKQVKFEPRKACRICKAEEAHLTVIFVGNKIPETKLFLYCMAKVCIPCLAVGEAEEFLSVMMIEGSDPLTGP